MKLNSNSSSMISNLSIIDKNIIFKKNNLLEINNKNFQERLSIDKKIVNILH